MTAKLAGRIAPVSGESNAQLEGQISYDLERMTGLLRPWLGANIRMAGRNASAVSYRGPVRALRLAAGKAAAGLRWDSTTAYGIQIGPGELKAAMADGVAQVEPLDLAVSQGRLHLAPRLRLAPDPMELTLPPGPLAQQIQIDPAMCAESLKFLIPSFAGVIVGPGLVLDRPGRLPHPVERSDEGRSWPAGLPSIRWRSGRAPLTGELGTFLSRAAPAKTAAEVGRAVPHGRRPGLSRRPGTGVSRVHDPHAGLGRIEIRAWSLRPKCPCRRSGWPTTR